ncbi:MAG: hypothetical protein JW963_03420 [Anaerolineales bacterium]|nr:hypothetical protein [Anaerolineales bacterium]
MKKIFLSILLLFVLTLTACGTSNANQISSKQASDDLPVAAQLVIGTPQLEGTEQAVTSAQAKELLPMWQVYQNISSSGTGAQAEVDGLIEQIQGTMSAGQMQAITAMDLTQQDIFAAIQAQNITASSGGRGQSSNSGGGSFEPPGGGGDMAGGAPPDGGMGGGGAPPDGGMGDMGGMGSTGPSSGTDQSQDMEAGPGVGGLASVPTALVEALIQYLEQIANS